MNFELEIIKWLQSFRTPFLDNLFEFFTIFGEELVVIAILGGIYWSINKRIGERLGITVFISLGLNSLLKAIFMRLRPFMVDTEITNLRPETSGGYSMPSGHTQSASTVFFGVYQFFKKKYLLIIAIIITVLVAISRMYIGVHYLTDVLVGAFLGILITYYLAKYLSKKEDLSKIYNIILIISGVALVGLFVYNLISLSGTSFDSETFYFNTEALAKMIGTLAGFVLGVRFENKYVNFLNHNNLLKNILRFALGIAVVMAVRIGLKEIFTLIVNPEELIDNQMFLSILASFLDFLRYVIMVMVGIGIYPLLFKKINI
ncbi:MAG: phosphatase PAP2 family protein [Candidatus Izemoplasmatales bacterium]|jgi:membrane-associated phospholipid phosphatase|nr:phosphatase PAP2 family protein [Candidatus Izemoplasmatales bacterium]